MVDFIHIGDYKTGTTWMQKFGFKHPEIEFLGDPVDYQLDSLLRKLVNTPDFMYNKIDIKKDFYEYFKSKDNTSKIIGLSREGLIAEQAWKGDNIKRNAERIKEIFPNAKIIYVIREQKSMILSFYSQYIKRGGTLSLEKFIFDPYQNISFIERFKYHYIIDIYCNLFGKENVFIGLYEEFLLDKPTFLHKLYKFIGCKNVKIIPEEYNYRIKTNVSLKKIPILALRLLNRFIRSEFNNSPYFIPIDTLIRMLLSKKQYENLEKYSKITMIPYYDIARDLYINKHVNDAIINSLVKLVYKINFGKKIELSNKISNFIEREYKESNRILLHKYQLPIDKFNWSI